jgi:hypothetical protein
LRASAREPPMRPVPTMVIWRIGIREFRIADLRLQI